MAGDQKQGIAAAVAGMDVGSPPGEGAAQEPLFADDFERADAPSPFADVDERRGRRGGGRPPGAKNKRTEEWATYILSRYRSPLIALAEIYSRPVHELARDLDCEALDALKVQRDAAAALAPYIHQRMPQAVHIDERRVGVLVLGDFRQDVTALGGLPIALDESEENQGVIDGQAQQSDGEKSDG
jgi:hypothetical protein